MLRTAPLLIRALPTSVVPVAGDLPFGTALGIRLAQLWEVGRTEDYQWYSEDLLYKFTRLLDVLSVGINNVPQSTYETAQCQEAWDTYHRTLFTLLKTWRTASQDPEKWFLDRSNAQHRVSLIEAYNHFPPYLHPVIVSGVFTLTTTNAFLAGRKSLVEAAKTMAYKSFSQILFGQERFAFCPYCDAAFVPGGKRTTYHTVQCGSRYTSRQRKRATARDNNYKRIFVATNVLAKRCRKHSRIGSYEEVTNTLLDDRLTAYNGELEVREAKWYGQFVLAAEAGVGSPRRALLLKKMVGPGASDLDVQRMSDALDKLYSQILDAIVADKLLEDPNLNRKDRAVCTRVVAPAKQEE